ncbi:MAG: UDP-3-O-(3-hydroxymyristoyl)glucosamine N-acyltransferase [Flexilinea sp.]
MRLSEFLKPGWTLVRDGEFSSLGLCNAQPGIPILTFAGNKKYLKQALKNPDVTCVMIPPDLIETDEVKTGEKGICSVPELRIEFFLLHNNLAGGRYQETYCGKSQPTQTGSDCEISPLAEISAHDVIIGNHVTIEAFASIKENTVIGDNCIIRSGTVLGGNGLEFIRMDDRGILPVTHCGRLIIGKAVEIQYNCNVSRSLFPWHSTILGDECKIESLVHIAHGVHLGKRNLIAASACIAGSAILGDDVWVGPNATVSSEVTVGNGARVSLGAVVISDVPPRQTVTGNFAIDHERFMQEMMKRIL